MKLIQKRSQTHLAYIPALDGLRGLAIIMVILYHNFGYVNLFSFGWLGVDLFFVLSGYLITRILLYTRYEAHFLRNFYIRRALRIFPLYYLILFVVFLVVPFLNIVFFDLLYFHHNQSWFWLYLQNILFITSLDENAISLTHLWTLAIEEQYYLFWPIVILILKKDKTLLQILSLILVSLFLIRIILWFIDLQNFSYFNFYTFSRFDGILVGSILAICIKNSNEKVKQYQNLLLIILLFLNLNFYFFRQTAGIDIPYLATLGYPTISILFALILYNIILFEFNILNKLFENKVLIFFGKISYGLYILHWPIYIISINHFGKQFKFFEFPIADSILKSLLLTAIATILSFISFNIYEKPFIKFKAKLS